MGNINDINPKNLPHLDSIFDKSIDITVEYENLNCDSNKKIFTQFEDKVLYNCNVTIYN
jgi:hypothetical protein